MTAHVKAQTLMSPTLTPTITLTINLTPTLNLTPKYLSLYILQKTKLKRKKIKIKLQFSWQKHDRKKVFATKFAFFFIDFF